MRFGTRIAVVAPRLLAVALLGCGGGATAAPPSDDPGSHPPNPTPPPTVGAEDPAPVSEPVRPELDGRIARAELLPILEAGLPRFLQGVETEPYLAEGRFVGFELVGRPWPGDARFADTGLEPGDVIVRVNGQPIERPEQALRVWESLRVASELMIEYLRDGTRDELRFAIVE